MSLWLTQAPEAVLVQAEAYNAFSDSDAGNNGRAYRNDAVDIEATTDVNGGFNVGWTKPGEWLQYAVTVAGGSYRICTRVASAVGNGAFTLKVDGQQVAAHAVHNTGGWQRWVTMESAAFTAGAGTRLLRLDVQSGDFNVNWFEVTTGTCSIR